MKKSLSIVAALIVFGFIASRTLNTWNFIGGAIQPGGGGKVDDSRVAVSPPDVRPDQLIGAWKPVIPKGHPEQDTLVFRANGRVTLIGKQTRTESWSLNGPIIHMTRDNCPNEWDFGAVIWADAERLTMRTHGGRIQNYTRIEKAEERE